MTDKRALKINPVHELLIAYALVVLRDERLAQQFRLTEDRRSA